MRIAVLMTCFNRRETTLECLRHLEGGIRLSSANHSLDVDVWLNDDGSTDGTDEAVTDWAISVNLRTLKFKLNLIRGSGSDYWCGGMRRAWQAAVDSGIEYDGYIWLNDDTLLFEKALSLLLEPRDGIVVGATCDSNRKCMTYGGKDIQGYDVVPNGTVQEVEILNGNFVYVPRKAFEVLGTFPDYFTHSMGDYDYGKRAREAGIKIYTTRDYIGICEKHDKPVVWKDPSQPLLQRFRNLYSPLGGAEPPIFFRYNRLHYGLAPAWLRYLKQHAIALFPRIFA